MRERKQISLEELFLLYPQLRSSASADAERPKEAAAPAADAAAVPPLRPAPAEA